MPDKTQTPQVVTPNVSVRTYADARLRETWAYYVEPVDGDWTLFVPADGGDPCLVTTLKD